MSGPYRGFSDEDPLDTGHTPDRSAGAWLAGIAWLIVALLALVGAVVLFDHFA